ncbi:hypothetical protein A3F08_00755 [Candidatus Berkelbacteria bacterium RIFCSPHIGHO2_12_FULL_36_9]|uniref:Polymerase nucleotidyl transferase domain-containing protein n=1 Tax=Candidatus Berkelbacteria bacterium RIFCSPHIGHO2_12_FULL_36_9 TaxID=1797469 RepID=A0A1F5EJI3_9BACT|nr:MAG: hypothetical protein A3F08_00755 [Candidatus Berkelbacteria bacterium RIFCSPHIGHO2_12_FULL_36_9]
MKNIPKNVNNLFSIIKQEIPRILEDNLIGIYVFGSLTYNAYKEGYSDVDIMTVVNKELNDEEIKKLRSFFKRLEKENKLAKKLEVIFVTKKDIISDGSKIFKTTQTCYGEFRKRTLSDGANPII